MGVANSFVEHTSLSHWYTWPAVSATTLASSAAWPDGYSLIHQCMRSSHCCRVSLDLAKKLPSRMERVFRQVVTGHLHLKQCNLCWLFLFVVLHTLHNHVLLSVGTSALCKFFFFKFINNLSYITFVRLPETVADVCSHLPLHCSLAGRTVPPGS